VSLTGDIRKSSDVGAIVIQVENTIAFELFKSLFLTSRFRVVGAPVEREKDWGMCDWDDLKSIFDEFPSPWSYQIDGKVKSDVFVWADNMSTTPSILDHRSIER
jgi:hypothetical protein